MLTDLYRRFLARPGRRARPLSRHTRNKYKYDLLPFVEAHAHLDASQLQEHHVVAWFDRLENERGFRPATLAKHRSEIICFFNWLRGNGYTTVDVSQVIPRFASEPATIRLPHDGDVARLLAAANKLSYSDRVVERRDAAIILVAHAYGNRRGEIRATSLRDFWRALDSPMTLAGGKRAYVLTTTGKGGPARIALGEGQKAAVLRYLQLAPDPLDDALFINLKEEHPRYRRRLSRTGFDRSRRRMVKAAGLRHPLTFQDLRRLRGTEVARTAGVENAVIMLHHKDGGKTFRSYYYDPDDEAAFAAALRTLPDSDI